MGALEGCSRVFLVLVNCLFTLIGLAFLVVGCIVRFGSDVLDPYLQDLYAALQNFSKSVSGNDVNLGDLNIGEYLKDATTALIVIGVFFFVIGILGCFGACCKETCKWMLIVYAVLLILIVLCEVVFVIMLFTIRPTMDQALKTPMLASIKDGYSGFNGTNVETLGWNFAMINFKCCGVDNYTDFQEASKWTKTYSRDGIELTLAVPIACCKLNGTFPSVQVPSDLACATDPTKDISNIEKGCYDAIWDILHDNRNIMIGVGAGTVAVELLMIVFAFCVFCSSRKKDDDDYNYDY